MYKVGDKVTYGPQGYKAKILRVWGNGDYMIEFDKKDLIPPQMDVPESHLNPDIEDIFSMWDNYQYGADKNPDNCPRCGDKWKETWIGHKPFYDCLKCNLKREDS